MGIMAKNMKAITQGFRHIASIWENQMEQIKNHIETCAF